MAKIVCLKMLNDIVFFTWHLYFQNAGVINNYDQVWENWSYSHILYFEKYEFEILNALFFSCGTIQLRQIFCIVI